VVTLHGAGGDAARGTALLHPLADTYNLALLAPASRGSTRNALCPGHYGSDITILTTSSAPSPSTLNRCRYTDLKIRASLPYCRRAGGQIDSRLSGTVRRSFFVLPCRVPVRRSSVLVTGIPPPS
jgi:hypothetical protein